MFKITDSYVKRICVLDCTVKGVPPSTINGWVNNSVVTLAVNAADLIAVILLLVTVTVGVPADVTRMI